MSAPAAEHPRFGHLRPHHVEDLLRSGLSTETILSAGFYSAMPDQVRDLLGFAAGAGLAIPYPANGHDGARAFVRVKLDQADPAGKRYRTPRGGGNHVYVPLLLDESVLADPATPLYVVEGEKKALKAVQEGLATIALAGVWSWRHKPEADGPSVPIPDLDRIAWQGRTVYIVFDSDLVHKPTVAAAERALAEELGRRGATVAALRLPSGPDGAKVGLDDYLCTHSVETLCALEPVPLAAPPGPLGIGLGRFLTMPDPPTEAIIEGLLSDDGGGWRGGEEKTGKTLWVEHEALCVALGRPVAGRFAVPHRRRVLFVEEEDSPRRTRRRFRALLRGLGLDPDDPEVQAELDGSLHVSVWAGLLLDNPAGLARLEAEIRAFTPALVYLDVLRKLTLRDLNKAAEAGALLAELDRLRREHGVLFLLVHHYRKQSQGFRAGRGSQELSGSYQLGAWGENSLFFEPIGRKHGAVKVEVQCKDLPPVPAFKLVIESEGPRHDPHTIRLRAEDVTDASVRDTNRQKVLEALSTLPTVEPAAGKPGVLVAALATALTLSSKTVRACLKELKTIGQADIVGAASKGADLWAALGQ